MLNLPVTLNTNSKKRTYLLHRTCIKYITKHDSPPYLPFTKNATVTVNLSATVNLPGTLQLHQIIINTGHACNTLLACVHVFQKDKLSFNTELTCNTYLQVRPYL